MEARVKFSAIGRNIRVSPKRMNFLVRGIRGRSVSYSLSLLSKTDFMKSSRLLRKLILAGLNNEIQSKKIILSPELIEEDSNRTKKNKVRFEESLDREDNKENLASFSITTLYVTNGLSFVRGYPRAKGRSNTKTKECCNVFLRIDRINSGKSLERKNV